MAEERKRKYLAVSAVSALGRCETKVIEYLFKPKPQTPAQAAGTAAHKAAEAKAAPMTKAQLMDGLRTGLQLDAREVMLYDSKSMICGRIDHLQATGRMEQGRNASLVIDDKYPYRPDRIYGITLPYKLQLSGYAVAISGSEYGPICRIIGAQLIYRETGTDRILKRYEMDSARLDACTANMQTAISTAWQLYRGEKEPVHRRFDVETGEWVRCWCDSPGEPDGSAGPGQAADPGVH